MIQFSHYKHIIYDEKVNVIIKLPRQYIEDIIYEYNIYKSIDHPAFSLYTNVLEIKDLKNNDIIIITRDDKLVKFKVSQTLRYSEYMKWVDINKVVMLIGTYNRDYQILNIYNNDKNIIDIYINILNILDDVHRRYNFVHGDFKSNNILINKHDINDIKFIDFEFSLIFNKSEINIYNYDINLYLDLDGHEVFINKDFGLLFDIYELVVDFIYHNSKIEETKNKLNDLVLLVDLDLFIDFYILFYNLYDIPNYKFIDTESNCYMLTFSSICRNLSNIKEKTPLNIPLKNDKINERIDRIISIIDTNIKLNTTIL
jgi:serine/threonine protein kinase